MSTRRVDKTDSSVSFAPLKLGKPPSVSLGGWAEGGPERHSKDVGRTSPRSELRP